MPHLKFSRNGFVASPEKLAEKVSIFPKELKILNDLYDVYRLYVNFFLPSAKLIYKVGTGAKVRKHYDTPQTPYQGLMASESVPEEVKSSLQEQFNNLNPAALKKGIDWLKGRPRRANSNKTKLRSDNDDCSIGVAWIYS